jgi:hypothetical protein
MRAAAFTLFFSIASALGRVPFNAGFCANATRAAWPICDVTASLDERASDIVSRLTLTDKFNLTLMGPVNVTLDGLESFTWWSEATHGVGSAWNSHEHIPATNFPMPISTSCAFNRSLWAATGNQIGREARAQQNNGRNGNTFWAPVINIVRDPREDGARAFNERCCAACQPWPLHQTPSHVAPWPLHQTPSHARAMPLPDSKQGGAVISSARARTPLQAARTRANSCQAFRRPRRRPTRCKLRPRANILSRMSTRDIARAWMSCYPRKISRIATYPLFRRVSRRARLAASW